MKGVFAVDQAPLRGQQLIEASAGTGKTWTIAGLYVRLLLETDYALEQILVVTYTRAATAELRDRLRSRLAQVHAALLAGGSEDPFIANCLAKVALSDRPLMAQRLLRALSGFDEAAIFTIHGFCQRVLRDAAFETGSAFGNEIVPDEKALIQRVMNDEWRRLTFHEDVGMRLWARWLVANGHHPERWCEQLAGLLEKPFICIPSLNWVDFSREVTEAQTAFQAVVDGWQAEKENIQRLLREQTVLDKRTYPTTVWALWFACWDRLEGQRLPFPNEETFLEKVTPVALHAKTKKNHPAPQHPWFEQVAVWVAQQAALQPLLVQQLAVVQAHLLHRVRVLMAQEKAKHQQLSYQDLLNQLHAALQGPQAGALVEWLRSRYPVALIDEFQDTDPIQYQIFQAIYPLPSLPGQVLFLVGDPKQAIYQFRGADIFTYLQAQQNLSKVAPHAVQTLNVNQRADEGLLDALNALFARHPEPFFTPEIQAVAVAATQRTRPRLILSSDFHPAALQMQLFHPSEKPLSKQQARERSVRACVAEIVRLLNAAARGDVYWQEGEQRRAFSGGDIAIVVSRHYDAAKCAEALQRVGIPSVRQGDDDVFATAQAQALWTWLQAVHQPQQARLVLAALSLPLFALDAPALLALRQDERAWEAWQMRFFAWQRRWQDFGFMSLFRAWLHEENYAAQLLAQPNGERELTNWLHLAELLQLASRERLTPSAQLAWFGQQIAGIKEQTVHPLRLESDAARVKIVTIHSSKGLEYGVVFCPFLWDGYKRTQIDRAQKENYPLPFHTAAGWQVALRPDEKSVALPLAHAAAFAENLRLTYVALTRAKARCYTWWGYTKDREAAALTWLLFPDYAHVANDLAAWQEKIQALAPSACEEALTQWVAQSQEGGHWTWCEDSPPLIPYQPPIASTAALTVRAFTRSALQPQWRVGSFSSLTAGQYREDADHDGQDREQSDDLTQSSTHLSATMVPLARFPRGAQAGTCLHAIFEVWEFTAPCDDKLLALVTTTLQRYGLATDFAPFVVQNVVATLQKPLFPTRAGAQVCLAQIPVTQRLVELEFTYPVKQLRCDALYECVAAAQVSTDFLRALKQCDFLPLQGFMKGFIDLVVRVDDKFYIIDYKSNFLGEQLEDYQPAALLPAMVEHHYYLQYWLYTVALHRYLQVRLANYSYERHFGGVAYLFLRGMSLHGNYGVFWDRPSKALIEALSALLDG